MLKHLRLLVSLMASFISLLPAYQDENLFDTRTLEPYSFGQPHAPWWLHKPWLQKQKNFKIQDKTLHYHALPGDTFQLRTAFYIEFDVCSNIKVSFEYQYDGKNSLDCFSALSPVGGYHFQKLPPAKTFRKATLTFPLDKGSAFGTLGFLSREKDTGMKLRNLVINTVDDHPTDGEAIMLDGQPCHVIYYDGKDQVDLNNHRFAGKLLRSTLYHGGGKLLPLKRYQGETLSGAILLRSAQPDAAIREGGYRLRIHNGGAIIDAKRPCGSEFGVLGLWEKLGLRYVVSTEAIRLKPHLEASALDETVVPGIPFRTCSGANERLGFSEQSRETGKYVYFGGNGIHPLEAFISQEEFAQSHPEYFALQADGTRGKCRQPGHLCTTNPQVVELVSQRLMEVIERQPEAQFFPMFWGDGGSYACRCERCRKVGMKNLNINFVNHIARRVAKRYPHVRLTTLAYVMSHEPPDPQYRPEPNVIVQYAPYAPAHMNSHQWVHALNDMCLKDLAGWEALHPQGMGAFTYPSSCRENLNIWPAFQCNVDQMLHFSQKGYKILVTCGNSGRRGGVPNANAFFDLNRYLIGRIAMFPHLDVKKETEFFMKHFFGPAAPEMLAYLKLLMAEVKQRDWGYNTEYIMRGFVTDALAQKAYELFAEAERKTKDDPIHHERILQEKIYLLWTDVTDNNRSNGKVTEKNLKEFADKLADFCRLCKRFGITYNNACPDFVKWFWDIALLRIENGYQPFYKRPMVEKFMQDPLKTLNEALPLVQEQRPYGWFIPASGYVGGLRGKTCWYRKKPINAVQLYRFSSGYGMTKAVLKLAEVPANSKALLKVYGIDNEKKDVARMELFINGKSIYRGPVPWGKEQWSYQTFQVPAGCLTKGNNEILFHNVTPDTEKDGIGGVNFLAKRNYFWGWYFVADTELHVN